MMIRITLAILASLIALLPFAFAASHDTFKRTTCYCASKPSAHHPFIANLRYKEYYNAGLDSLFIINDTCLHHSPHLRHCLPQRNRGEGKCVGYFANHTVNADGTPKFNHLCYNSRSEWEEILDTNWSARFVFNGQWRRLGGHGSKVTRQEVESGVVRETCEPLCEEHFGGVVMEPVNAGKGRVIESYEQVFEGFEDIVSCDGCAKEKTMEGVQSRYPWNARFHRC